MTIRRGLAILASAALASGLAACGGGDDNTPAGGAGGGSAKKGGTIRVLGTSYPDYLDPGLSYTVDGWQALQLVYPGLLAFPHKPGNAGAQVQPGLAEDLPDVSDDGLVWRFKLRPSLRFSDGTPLRASDFKASIERVLAMDSQGAGLG
jgi:peptide/nickel transport system substrate-binding protein